MTWRKLIHDYRNFLIIFITPLLLIPLPVYVTDQKGLCGYLLLLMGTYWCTEALPLGVTGLIPVFLCPLFGLLTTVDVCENYLKDSTMMFLGGFFVAIALEKSNLHLRLAIAVLKLVGTEPKWLMLGFMLPTWFLSMWISNTATVALMLPILEAVLEQLKQTHLGRMVRSRGHDNNAFTNDKTESLSGKSSLEDDLATDKDVQLTEFKSTQDKQNDIESQKDMHVQQAAKSQISLDEKDTIEHIITITEEESPEFQHLSRGMTLAIAYASGVGGIATLSTGPNTILKGHADGIWYDKGLGESPVTYTSWMVYGFPQAVINLILLYIWLRILYLGFRSFSCKHSMDKEQAKAVKEIIRGEYNKLGEIRYDEIAVGILFTVLIFLWVFRSPGFIPGWGDFFKEGYIGDAVPAIFIAVTMFCIPNKLPSKSKVYDNGKVDALLDWPMVHKKYPWSIIFLMGGGFALAEACEVSGLSQWIGEQLVVFGSLPGWLMVAIICFLVALMTEITSNSATCSIFMPIMATMAESLGMNPLYLMMPAAISSSFAFMLPASAASNAVAFTYGRMTVREMLKAGIVLKVICVLTATLATQTWAYNYFDYGTIPWSTETNVTTESSMY